MHRRRIGAKGALARLRAIGGCELLIDAISGMTINAGVVQSLTDLSGKGRAITIVNAPAATLTTWNGAQPAIRCTVGVPMRLNVTMPVPMAVYTMVAVIQGLGVGAADSSFYRDSNNNAISYVRAGTADWALYNGVVFASTFTTANSAGRYVRIDVQNTATSLICRSGTEQAGDAGFSRGGIVTNPLNIGTGGGGSAPLVCDLAAFAIYSKALSVAERAKVITVLAARYSGVSLT